MFFCEFLHYKDGLSCSFTVRLKLSCPYLGLSHCGTWCFILTVSWSVSVQFCFPLAMSTRSSCVSMCFHFFLIPFRCLCKSLKILPGVSMFPRVPRHSSPPGFLIISILFSPVEKKRKKKNSNRTSLCFIEYDIKLNKVLQMSSILIICSRNINYFNTDERYFSAE